MNVRRRQRRGDVGEVSAAGRQGCAFGQQPTVRSTSM